MRSPSDRLNDLQEKIQGYITNGAQLDWLVDRSKRESPSPDPDSL
jgi:Uma2 family endonuclease